MDRELHVEGLRTNSGFAGIYDFDYKHPYRDFLTRFMRCWPKPNGILVVHPRLNEDWRQNEFFVLRDYPFKLGTLNRFRPQLMQFRDPSKRNLSSLDRLESI